jgi:hypothetical protein
LCHSRSPFITSVAADGAEAAPLRDSGRGVGAGPAVGVPDGFGDAVAVGVGQDSAAGVADAAAEGRSCGPEPRPAIIRAATIAAATPAADRLRATEVSSVRAAQ